MRRRASSSSKRPARAGIAAASSSAATTTLFARVLDVGTAVLLPRRLIVPRRHGLLLAVADGLDACVAHAEHRHHLLHRFRATLAKGEVVLAAATLVAVAFDADARVALVARHVARMRLHHALVLVLDLVRVEVEVDAALGEDVARIAQRIARDHRAGGRRGRRAAGAPGGGGRRRAGAPGRGPLLGPPAGAPRPQGPDGALQGGFLSVRF